MLTVAATPSGNSIPLADVVKELAHDSVLLAANNLLLERNRSARSFRTSPRASLFATADRSTDDRAPRNAIVGEEFSTQSQFTRFDSLFGGVELFVPLIGGSARVRAGPRVSEIKLDRPIDDPSSTRDRITGEVQIPLYPWRLDLDYLNEEELKNEVSYLRSLASHRDQIVQLAGRASAIAWLLAAAEKFDSYMAPVASLVDTATILEKFGEISEQELMAVVSTGREIEDIRTGWQSEIAIHRAFLSRVIGEEAIITPPTAFDPPDSIVLPAIDNATDVLLISRELTLAQRRARITRRETGSKVNLEGNVLSDRYHDSFDERLRAYAAVYVTIPFADPAGRNRRNAAIAEEEWTEERLHDITRLAATVAKERLAGYRNALNDAIGGSRRLTMDLDRMRSLRAEFEAYQDPSSIVRLVQIHATIARDIDRIQRAENEATRYLTELLVDAGVGLETLALYLR